MFQNKEIRFFTLNSSNIVWARENGDNKNVQFFICLMIFFFNLHFFFKGGRHNR